MLGTPTAARREALTALSQDVDRLRGEVTEFLGRADADEAEGRTRQLTATTLKEEIAALAARRQDMVTAVVALRERCRADEMSLQESRAALSGVEQSARQARTLLETAREATRQSELEMARAEADSEHMVQECRAEFDCLPAELAIRAIRQSDSANSRCLKRGHWGPLSRDSTSFAPGAHRLFLSCAKLWPQTCL